MEVYTFSNVFLYLLHNVTVYLLHNHVGIT